MHTYKKLALTMSLAIFSLVLLAASASASRGIILEVRNPITATTNQSVFIGNNGLRVTCRLTLSGEVTTLLILKSSAGRLPEGQIGKITSGRSDARCEDNLVRGRVGDFRILAERERPILLRYDGYLGTLPAILGLLLTALRFEFALEIPGVARCLYVGDLRMQLRDSGGVSVMNTLLFDITSVIPLAAGQPPACPRTDSLLGVLNLTPGITLRLQA